MREKSQRFREEDSPLYFGVRRSSHKDGLESSGKKWRLSLGDFVLSQVRVKASGQSVEDWY